MIVRNHQHVSFGPTFAQGAAKRRNKEKVSVRVVVAFDRTSIGCTKFATDPPY